MGLNAHFNAIADGIRTRGWVTIPEFLPEAEWLPLRRRACNADNFFAAGIGRGDDFHQDRGVRTDAIRWLSPGVAVDGAWLAVMEQMRLALNRRLFLGLFEFEGHYALYEKGAFYKRHYDAFKGGGIRMLSVVLYLNERWSSGDGGELVLYSDDDDINGSALLPLGGTLVVFLSEDFPHQVLPAARERLSVAGWFRSNTSTGARPDPPA